MTDLKLAWRTSSRSANNGQCVEVAASGPRIAIRDTKQHGAGPILSASPSDWAGFIAAVAADTL